MIYRKRTDLIDAIEIRDPATAADPPFQNPPAWLTNAITAGLVTWIATPTGPAPRTTVSLHSVAQGPPRASAVTGDFVIQDTVTLVLSTLTAAALNQGYQPGGGPAAGG